MFNSASPKTQVATRREFPPWKRRQKSEEVTIICCLDRPEVDCVVAVYADPAVKGPANRVGMIHAISPLPQSNFIKLPNYMSSAPLSCLYTSRDIENDWFWNNLHSLDGDLAPFLMELLQIRLESIAGDSKIRKRLLQGMKLLNKLHGALPPSIVVHDVTREGTHPITGGGFADIWKGRRNGQPVCLKVLRIFTSSSDRKKLFKDLSNEVLIWKQLHHRHILPLYGVNMELFQPSYCIVSPWMSNGDIGSYLDKSAATDSTFERKVKLITEIAEGLSYLHELDPPVIHGDIKGSNVLISEDFHCRLADFGLSAIETQTQSYNVTNSAQNRGSIRWLAPELMNPNSVHTTLGCSKTRDIYAFGCTVVEILTGKPPFPEYKMELHVMIQVLSGTRPPRPAECTDELWDLIERCWDESLSQRPGAGWILNILRNCSLDLGSWEEVVEVGSEGEAKIPASSLQLSSMNALFSIPSTQDPPREDQNWASPDSWACVPAAESVSPVKDATLASDSPQPVPKADVDEDYVLIRKRTVSTSISVKESGRARSIPIQTSEQNPGGAASADQSAMQTQKQKGTFNSCAPSHIPPPISPQTPTLTSLVSKHNIREGYATIASPSCPASAFSLLSNGGASLRGSILINPGLPSTSQSGSLINHGRVHDSLDGVVRRPRGPRGPSASSFTRRDSRIMPNPTWSKPTSPVPVQSSLTIPKSFDPRSLPALRPGSTTGKSSKKLGLIIPAPNHSNFESYAGPSGFTPMSSQAPEEICIRPAAAPSHANDSLSHIIEEFNTDLRLEEAKRKDGAFFSKEWNDDAFKEISLLSGAVHKVQEKKTDRIMACKMIALPIRQHEDELSTIHSANHPNIILMYGAYASPSPSSRPVKLLMEFCEGGSLEAIGKCPKEKGAVLEETVAGRIAEGVLQGLDYLHSMRMTHRDIKPSNILLTRQGVVKLCDIAVSGELIESFAGISTDTSLYMSPERISGHEYNICSDVWSAGISLLELVQQRFPFPNDVPPIETMMYITSQDPPTLQDSGNQQWSDEMKDFIRQTLIHDAISRPYPRDMLKHTWIVGSMMQVVRYG
ncbi:hypothetical protein D9758_012084 [Tetrapyrgos nigripes]|uniref:mitogen-activated protein kinase kinase n=1 Tax=Tetrapyrgos nigripes TaxID=182062 RepID=A0A8H5CE32_9AGAR|nr:hypothetical protein D9758_012084 [Tetrapyrgos nigripes]